jgi:LAS superfamily LD-carboxypeptidase LdcB
MQHPHIKSFLTNTFPSLLIFFVLGAGLVYTIVELRALTARLDTLTNDVASTTQSLSNRIYQFSQNVTDLSNETTGLSTALNDTKQNIGSLSGTLSALQKLAEADPQLLKKYSKVYFLNENYMPKNLSVVPSEYAYSTTRQEQFLSEASFFLKTMLDTAKTEKVPLYVKSGFRSFAEQKSLKSAYSTVYGAGTANSFSADQGYSEHQLGTAVDFTTTGLNGNLSGFDKTPAYTWLVANAHRFGFILSYPKNNAYYIYEPWHWRYVGIQLATYLHDNNKNFYDMDQREIDKYLIDMFDWK